MSVGREFGGQDDETGLKAEIAFGMDCDSWMQSQIGRHLKKCAEREIEQFKERLVDVEADDAKQIRAIQMEIAARRLVFDWLNRAVQAGLAAQGIALEQGGL